MEAPVEYDDPLFIINFKIFQLKPAPPPQKKMEGRTTTTTTTTTRKTRTRRRQSTNSIFQRCSNVICITHKRTILVATSKRGFS